MSKICKTISQDRYKYLKSEKEQGSYLLEREEKEILLYEQKKSNTESLPTTTELLSYIHHQLHSELTSKPAIPQPNHPETRCSGCGGLDWKFKKDKGCFDCNYCGSNFGKSVLGFVKPVKLTAEEIEWRAKASMGIIIRNPIRQIIFH